jgi:hypothetical protein
VKPPIIENASTTRYLFKRQGLHVLALFILVPVAWALAAPTLGDGSWRGVPDTSWFWLGIALPVVHQFLAVLVWRSQLGWGTFTRLFAEKDLLVWGVLFMPLLVARPLSVVAVAMANRGSLALAPPIAFALGAVLLMPALYTFYSVARYFGIARALGGDHFRTRYREMPLVTEGAFGWTGHAMYALGFLVLWAIALFAGSHAALVVALFQHAYIWVHFYCTEKPDMELIYGSANGE